MKSYLEQFLIDEDGAVTVDWVVLTALVVTLLGAGFGQMKQSVADTGDATGTYLANRTDLLE